MDIPVALDAVRWLWRDSAGGGIVSAGAVGSRVGSVPCSEWARVVGSRRFALRVIAGTLRGRKLAAAQSGVRPTADRVRESVFNRLGDLDQARVLDLFAGSGALGIEAISRGAERLVAVDRAGRVVRALEQSIEALGIADLVTAWRLDARGAIRRLADAGERFDLVFVDPPYDADEYTPVLIALVESGILESGATVVVERAKRHALAPISGLEVEAERSYGDTVVSWLVTCESGKSIGGNGS